MSKNGARESGARASSWSFGTASSSRSTIAIWWKAAVSEIVEIGFTKSLARELGPEIRVNAIAPGPVLWPENGVDEELRARIVARTALKRSGTPEDVAKAALYFATDAPFVTGQLLAVDGGRLVGGMER